MKNNIIKVTGNNRKAVLAFLDKHMIGSHKPKNNPYFIVCRHNCYIELKNDYFTTHLEYNGPTMTLKEVRKIYEPKQTENEKRLQGRASMYKLKYEKLKESSSGLNNEVDKLNQDVITLMGLNSELKNENKYLIKNLDLQKQANKDSFKNCEKAQNEVSHYISEVVKYRKDNLKLVQERDTHLQLNSELRLTNTRLTDELIELEGKYHDLWARNQKIDEELAIQCSKNYDLHKRIKSSEFELDQSEQTNQSLIKEKYRYIAMIVLLTLTVITLCVLN